MMTNIKFQTLPYLEFSRGPSTSYNESIHVSNSNTGKALNFWFCKVRNTFTVSLFDGIEKPPKQTRNIISNVKRVTQKKVDSLFNEYLR